MTNVRKILLDMKMEDIARETVGKNASFYREYAQSIKYPYLEILDTTSSAGDWAFIISSDKKNWRVLSQINNWPKHGFTYYVSEEIYIGNTESVLRFIWNEYY